MNTPELKKKLAALWKETLNAPDDKISLILNGYFDPELVVYEEAAGGDLVAAIMGIPYDLGNSDCSVKALFLVGLATKSHFRSRGIMTRLLSKINDVAREKGFVFSFLIPPDEGLRKYFKDRGFVNGFYRVVDNYTSLHDFDNEYESILQEQKEKVADLKRNLFKSLKVGVYDVADADAQAVRDNIRSLIRNIETSQQDLQIIHSDLDIDLAIEYNMVAGGQIYYVKNASGGNLCCGFLHVLRIGCLHQQTFLVRFGKSMQGAFANQKVESISWHSPSHTFNRNGPHCSLDAYLRLFHERCPSVGCCLNHRTGLLARCSR